MINFWVVRMIQKFHLANNRSEIACGLYFKMVISHSSQKFFLGNWKNLVKMVKFAANDTFTELTLVI